MKVLKIKKDDKCMLLIYIHYLLFIKILFEAIMKLCKTGGASSPGPPKVHLICIFDGLVNGIRLCSNYIS